MMFTAELAIHHAHCDAVMAEVYTKAFTFHLLYKVRGLRNSLAIIFVEFRGTYTKHSVSFHPYHFIAAHWSFTEYAL